MSVYRRILVPIDDSDTAERGLHEAIVLARQDGGDLHVLHVLDDYPMHGDAASVCGFEEMLDARRRRGHALLDKAQFAAQQAGVTAQTCLREATRESVADVILDEAKAHDCALIVMGTHGRHGMTRLALGSEAQAVVCRSEVPVMLVKVQALPTG